MIYKTWHGICFVISTIKIITRSAKLNNKNKIQLHTQQEQNVRVQQTDFFGEWEATFLRIQNNPLALATRDGFQGGNATGSKEQEKLKKTKTTIRGAKAPL